MKLSELGDFKLIERFSKRFLNTLPSGVVGIGDDCAVVPVDASKSQLLTTDMLVEDVHFLRESIAPQDLGHKSLAVNFSDIAAMGGVPKYVLLSIALPADLDVKWLDYFFEGFANLAEKFGVHLIGGDTTRSLGKIVISITVLGEAQPDRIKLRSFAKEGDFICVTGSLGDSGAGLRAILGKLEPDPEIIYLAKKHYLPTPHLLEGQWLASRPDVHAMMDVSDGIDSDLRRIINQSHCGARVDLEKLPLSRELLVTSSRRGWNAPELAATAGEDYCLLVTIRAEDFEAVAGAYSERFTHPLYPIGHITSAFGTLEYFFHGKASPLHSKGFDHFSLPSGGPDAGSKTYRRVLTIAGSDSGGGAGIQADIKAFSALGCYAMSALTALTAQNTVGVESVFPVAAHFVSDQIEAVLEDIGADAIKIGMLHRTEVIEAVARCLSKWPGIPVVLDPVMVAKSGDALLEPNAIRALKELLIPLATVLTPNIPEASILLDRSIVSREEMVLAAEDLLKLGSRCVLLKGGHGAGADASDYAVTQDCGFWLETPRILTINCHGTGCTLSAAIAAFLARGYSVEQALRSAKGYITRALASGAAFKIGRGQGPVHHFHEFWKSFV